MSASSSPVDRFEQRLRGRTSAATLRGRVLEAERATVLRTLDALAADDAILRAAGLLAGARRRFLLGSGRSAAWARQMAVDLSRVLSNVRTLTDPDDVVAALVEARAGDAVLAYSFRRYRSLTVDGARAFAEADIPVIAITDDLSSPIASFATETVVLDTSSASSSDSATPIAMANHLLHTLVAASAKGARRRLTDLEDASAELIRFVQDVPDPDELEN